MRRIIAALLITTTVALAGITIREHQASAVDPVAEADFVNRINALRAANGRGGLTVHSVLVAKAQAWADHMAATRSLVHSRLTDGITVSWRKLGENIGRGPSVTSVHNALVASPAHFNNMVDAQFRYIGVGVSYGGGQLYVVEVFMDGDPPPIPSEFLMVFDSRGRSIADREQGGFWVLQGNGTVHNSEGAPALGYPSFGGDMARDIAAMPDGQGYVVLDAWGGVHRFGSAVSLPLGGPYWPGWAIARSIAIAPDGAGYVILDGFGGVHQVGSTPKVYGAPYWHGWDIARAVVYTPAGGLYVLDGWGKVWATSGAPDRGTPYWHGWDIARDLAVWPDGNGYAVIDGFGAVHRFGTAKAPAATAWAPLDRWRGITVQSNDYLVIRNDGAGQRV
ncbi:MAG: CAP domain-containing protein [Actinobacteria bacterium]|nr:CAP domain-containing protein [Actinomycetota bacterium]